MLREETEATATLTNKRSKQKAWRTLRSASRSALCSRGTKGKSPGITGKRIFAGSITTSNLGGFFHSIAVSFEFWKGSPSCGPTPENLYEGYSYTTLCDCASLMPL